MSRAKGRMARHLTELRALHGMPHGDGFLREGIARRLLDGVVGAAGSGPFAVFAYGSLMWSPDFEPAFEAKARIYGYSRRPCIWSATYRGTPERPGLVFGLDRGGSCTGFLLGLPRGGRAALIRRLFVREMFQGVYYPRVCRAHPLGGGDAVRCLAFVANRLSPAYAPPMPAKRLKRIVAAARGRRGPCADYWRQTRALLKDHGIGWDPGFDLDGG